MKTICTCLLLLCIVTASRAQQRDHVARVETHTVGIVPVHRIIIKDKSARAPLARLYRRPNARVKKALSFTTKAQRPKVA